MKTVLLSSIVILTARLINAASGPINGTLLYGYGYIGCAPDTLISNTTSIPFLGYRQAWTANYTIEHCILLCSNGSHVYAGLRNGIEVSSLLISIKQRGHLLNQLVLL